MSEAPDVRLRAVEDADLPILFEQQTDPPATEMAAFLERRGFAQVAEGEADGVHDSVLRLD